MKINGANFWKIIENRKMYVLGVVAMLFWVGCFFWAIRYDRRMFSEASSREIVMRTWRGYQDLFIDSSGRVRQSYAKELVSSELQALAMLRAVWLGDKEVFDRCYHWAEMNLSRRSFAGDDLLASLWGFGRILEKTTHSSADVDYALSLVFAETVWPGRTPPGLTPYGTKARAVLRGILERDVFRSSGGRLYLAKDGLTPGVPVDKVAQQLSDYSPAHFRIFGEVTGDPRWRSLTETGYGLFDALARGAFRSAGVKVFPDEFWVDKDDRIGLWGGLRNQMSWQSFRVVWRFGLDHFWFGEPRVKPLLERTFAGFVSGNIRREGTLYAVYDPSGVPESNAGYNDPIPYAMGVIALRITDDPLEAFVDKLLRGYLWIMDGSWQYNDYQEPNQNALCWLVDGFKGGFVRNMRKDR